MVRYDGYISPGDLMLDLSLKIRIIGDPGVKPHAVKENRKEKKRTGEMILFDVFLKII